VTHGCNRRNRSHQALRNLVAVDDLSFEVEVGTVTGCLGPNRAGKTTTLRMLLSLVTPTAGTATFPGRPYHELAAPKVTVGAMLEASASTPAGVPPIPCG
jgi:ABC-2 type transport system ATP-binding protein